MSSKSYHAAYMRNWRRSHSLTDAQRRKDNARSKAGVYKRRGILTPLPCEDCGSTEVEMHHIDYNYPLIVAWLCRPCHLSHHRDS
jgi:hypothetical protein